MGVIIQIMCVLKEITNNRSKSKKRGCTMIIFTLWVTGLGLLSSSSITLEKWLRCQIGWPSWLSRDNYGAKNCKFSQGYSLLHFINGVHAHLQHQRDAGGEEGHKHKIVGQDRHAAKAAHDFQLTNPWKRCRRKLWTQYKCLHTSTHILPFS